MTQDEIRSRIEALFALSDPGSARQTARELERLVRQVEDPSVRARYEAAIDHLEDMLKHLDGG